MINTHVSIITPNYNSAKYLPETIESVLTQTYSNWEWFIIDDCSADDSIEIIKSYNDDRIKLIRNKTNTGAAIARNKGIETATGRYLTFLDSDDVWLPHFLETTLNFMQTNQYEIVSASYHRRDEDLQPLLDDFVMPEKIDYNRLLYNCPMPMLTTIYDTNRIGKIPIPLVDKREDYAMWLSIMKKIPRAYGIKEPLAIYRIRKGSYSRNKFEMAKKQFNVYFNFLKLPLHQSIFYTLSWAFNGLKKYGKL